MNIFKKTLSVVAMGILTISCTTENEQTLEETTETVKKKTLTLNLKNTGLAAKGSNPLQPFLELNKNFSDYQIAEVEIYTVASSIPETETVTVLPIPDASSTEYRTGYRYMPKDARRNGRTNLTYLTVSEFATSSNGIASEQIFDEMYAVWSNDSHCNNVSIEKQDFNLTTDGLPSSILSFGGDPLGPLADSNIIGYIPAFIFEAIGLGENTLAVNFTFGFLDENGNYTDINHDGKIDISHTETWFNDSYTWSSDEFNTGGIDVASVALHEFGHSVGLDHSGTLLVTYDDNGQFTGQLEYVPTNVMNPIYLGTPKRDLAGDDNSIYCEMFSAWPWY